MKKNVVNLKLKQQTKKMGHNSERENTDVEVSGSREIEWARIT